MMAWISPAFTASERPLRIGLPSISAWRLVIFSTLKPDLVHGFQESRISYRETRSIADHGVDSALWAKRGRILVYPIIDERRAKDFAAIETAGLLTTHQLGAVVPTVRMGFTDGLALPELRNARGRLLEAHVHKTHPPSPSPSGSGWGWGLSTRASLPARALAITCATPSMFVITSRLETRTVRYPRPAKRSSRNRSFAPSCVSPSTSTISPCCGQRKSAMKGGSTACRRNLWPASCEPERIRHTRFSGSVGLRRIAAARSCNSAMAFAERGGGGGGGRRTRGGG